MKKIFLTLIMVLALLCLLTVAVFAEGIVKASTTSDEYGTVIQLTEDPGLDNAKQYVSILNKINDAGTDRDALCIMTDGTYFYVFPSSYVVDERADGVFDIYAGTSDKPGLAQAMVEFNDAMSTGYYEGYALKSSDAAKRIDELVRFEFPSSVAVANDTCCMRAYPKLVEVRISHAIDFSAAKDMFINCTSLKNAIGFENATGLSVNMFMFCRSLESVSIPVNTVRIPDGMFFGCGTWVSTTFTIPNLSECTQLTTIGADAFRDSGRITIALPDTVTTLEDRAFQAGCKTGSIVISTTSKLQIIGDDAFNSCSALKTLYIPSSVTSIGKGAFHGCSYLTTLENFENCQITVLKSSLFEGATSIKTLVIPKNVTTIENAFIGTKNLTKVYFPMSLTSLADTFVNSAWENQPTNAVYIFTGKDTSVFADCARLKGATVITADEYDEAGKYTGINLVVGYSHCVVYNNGVHGEVEAATVVKSYLEAIKVVTRCVLCGIGDENGSIPALFTCQGYSLAETGEGGIVIGYLVNKAAVEEYKQVSGVEIKFGVFAVSQNKLEDKDVFSADGTAATGVVYNETSEYEYSAFVLKITGIVGAYLDAKLALGAYVAVTDESGTVYSYMQDTTKGEQIGNYYFASYNNIKGVSQQ